MRRAKRSVKQFTDTVWMYYQNNKRKLPWRSTTNPYHIFISEIMLQQTQVSRVLTKYSPFILRFPTLNKLADAPLHQVLAEWQGLGYNRRALFLKKAAVLVQNEYNGLLPEDPALLLRLPGIGKATASSIVVFAYNRPLVFIETNIRRVFIHHFFENKTRVDDNEINPLIEQTMEIEKPREWYYALMDYGTFLGKQKVNPNKRSKHYSVQPRFSGSDRQIRGIILRLLLKKEYEEPEIIRVLGIEKSRAQNILQSLRNEGFIVKNKTYSLAVEP